MNLTKRDKKWKDSSSSAVALREGKTLRIQLSWHDNQWKVFHHKKRFKVIKAGRRWGKTRGAIQWLVENTLVGKDRLGMWVAPTYRQAKIAYRYFRKIFHGTGIIKRDNKTELSVELLADCRIEFRSSDQPDNLRGEGIDALVLDESASQPEEVWTEVLRPALMDSKGEAVFIGTPKGRNWFHDLWERGQDPENEDWVSWQFSTYDNPYIDRKEVEKLSKELPKRVVDQEINAESLEEIAGALWIQAVIDKFRVHAAPKNLFQLCIAVDPSVTGKDNSDECGIFAVGKASDNHKYVLEDGSLVATPLVWAAKAVKMYHRWKANAIVAEVNNGGDMVEITIHQVDPTVIVKSVHASRGKAIRAEPASAEYEKGRVHHVGQFDKAERELTHWVPDGKSRSPNRLDAIVWGVTFLDGTMNGQVKIDFI